MFLVPTLAQAEAPPDEVERRGLRRAGIALFTAGVSALPSSAALFITSEQRLGVEAAGMALVGHALMGAGIPMWVAGATGRRTVPRNAALMYTGLVVAGVGLAALPPSSALFAASLDSGASPADAERYRTIALATGAGANLLIVAGIPMWAVGAAAREDEGGSAVAASPGLGITGGALRCVF